MQAVNRPVNWWGWHWEPPVPMSVIELIRAGNMSPRLAALFWVGMERGASLVVAADPPSAGKTTTVSALLSFTPPRTLAYFTCGQGEPFVVPPLSLGYPTYLLINEMSDHLPVYTWGEEARQAFRLLDEGYRMATTMHADTVEDVLSQLQDGLGVPPKHVANLTFIVPLYIARQGGIVRRVREVAFLAPDGDAAAVSSIARWEPGTDEFHVLTEDGGAAAFAAWAGLTPGELEHEVARRERFLRTLLENGIVGIPQVDRAIAGFQEQGSGNREQGNGRGGKRQARRAKRKEP